MTSKTKSKSIPSKSEKRLAEVEARVRRLEEALDQNTSVFIDTIRHLEVRAVAAEMVIEQLHQKSLNIVLLEDGGIHWEQYRHDVQELITARLSSASESEGSTQFDPMAEQTEEPEFPEGARVFSMT
jgi:hypothetical protein